MQIGCRLCRRRSGRCRDKAADKMPMAGRKGLEGQRKITLYPSGGLMADFGLTSPYLVPLPRADCPSHAPTGTAAPPNGHRSAARQALVCQQTGTGMLASPRKDHGSKKGRPLPPKKQKSAPGGRYMKNMPPDVAEVGVGHPGCARGISPQEGSLTTGHSISLPFLDKAHPKGHKQFLQVTHLGDQFPALVGVFHHHAL